MIAPVRKISFTLFMALTCAIATGGIPEQQQLEYYGKNVLATETTGFTEQNLQIKNRTWTSVFDPGTGRSFIATLCLFIFKIIKIACLCFSLTLLFILICPILPLLLPAVILSLLLAIFLIPILVIVPPVQMQIPPVPTLPPTLPPFTSIPAKR